MESVIPHIIKKIMNRIKSDCAVTANEKELLTRQLILKGTCFVSVANSIVLSFADAGDGGLFDAMNSSTETLLSTITTFLNTSILPWAILAMLVSLGLAGGNERALPVLKSAFKWIIIAFLGVNVVNLIVNTVLWVADTINGSV